MKLPGVGIRYEFVTEEGRTVGVVAYRSGRREILAGSPKDPDEFKAILNLGSDDSRTIAELMGASRVAEELSDLQRNLEGLAIDWLPIRAGTVYAGKTIGDAGVRTRTGVSIVAVVRDEQAIPAPGPDHQMQPGDYLVVVGTPRGIEDLVELLHAG